MSGRKRSWVWQFFEKSGDGSKATCSICNGELCFNSSTSALNNHLIMVHKKSRENERPTVTQLNEEIVQDMSIVKRKTIYFCNSERQESISRATARFIATNMLPISLVTTEGFKDFMMELEPGFKIPCEISIHSRLQLLYKGVRDQIARELVDAVSVSISVDEWSSRTQDCYISVEAQFFNSNCDLCSVTLCNEELKGRPNAENITFAIEACLEQWNISQKVQAITHDSANVMNATAQKLLNIPDSVKCSAHLLQLVVKDAIGSVSAYGMLCKKGKKLSGHFHRSNIAKSALSARQVQLGIKENCLVQCCEIRWNSKLHMCQSLLLNRNAICLVLADRTITKSCDAVKLEFTESEWTEMATLVKLLMPFDKATTVLCSAKSVTISLVRPLIHRLIQNHMCASNSEDANETKFIESAKKSLVKRFDIDDNSRDTSAGIISAFLDPRYKNLQYENMETKLKVHDFIKNNLEERNSNIESVSVEQITDMDFLFEIESIPTDVKTQMDLYLAEPQVGYNINPLSWWKSHSEIYPEIFKLAKRYLCIAATSAESERTFSSAGNIVSQRRSCLLPQNVNLLTFLYQNRRYMKVNLLEQL